MMRRLIVLFFLTTVLAGQLVAANITAVSAAVYDSSWTARSIYFKDGNISLRQAVNVGIAGVGMISFTFTIKNPAGTAVFHHTGNAAPSVPGDHQSQLVDVPITCFYTSLGKYLFEAKATLDGEIVTQVCDFTIKDTEAGTVSLIGGPRGFVNPASGEKLSIGAKATAPGTIKTSIFDGKGRLVREYSVSSNGIQTTVIQWDGKDSSGRNIPSGVYLIHVEGPGINITKRTAIIK